MADLCVDVAHEPVLVAIIDSITRDGTQRLSIAIQDLRVECMLYRAKGRERVKCVSVMVVMGLTLMPQQ